MIWSHSEVHHPHDSCNERVFLTVPVSLGPAAVLSAPLSPFPRGRSVLIV
jgi:hypothetical protein